MNRSRDERVSPGALRIGLVDDHALIRDGLITTVEQRGGHTVVVSCRDLSELDAWLAQHPRRAYPDVLLLDLLLHGQLVNVNEARTLMQRGLRILIVSGTRHSMRLQDLMRAGVAGYVAKEDPPEELLAAIQAAASGVVWTSRELAHIVANDPIRPQLSDRELEAVTLYARGLTMTSVARRMGVSYETARQYVDRARSKWSAVGRDARTKTQLSDLAREDGLLDG